MNPDSVRKRVLRLGSALLHEASGRRGWVGPSIRPAWDSARMAGPCRTVQIPPGDNLGVHIALEHAEPGEILCVGTPGMTTFAVWGEVVTTFALMRGVGGLLTVLGVRDISAIEALGFPVFVGSYALQGTAKRDPGRHQVPVRIGQALVRPGDWLVGDADGCTVIRAAGLGEAIRKAERKVLAERDAIEAIRAGRPSRIALGLEK